jgi:hypothetical protein
MIWFPWLIHWSNCLSKESNKGAAVLIRSGFKTSDPVPRFLKRGDGVLKLLYDIIGSHCMAVIEF